MKRSKYFIKIVCLLIVSAVQYQHSHAQLLDRVKQRVRQTVEDKVVNKAGESTEKGMNKAEEKLKKSKDNKDEKPVKSPETTNVESNKTQPKEGVAKDTVQVLQAYANYDFVPGDKILFECDFSDERNGELPGRFTLLMGNAEIQTLQQQKVLHMPPNNSMQMIPVMKTNQYLPEQFTFEFDVMMYDNEDYYGTLNVYFQEGKDAKATGYESLHYISFKELFDNNNASLAWEAPGGISTSSSVPSNISGKPGTWKHIAIYVNKNIGKLYVDQHRVRAVNNLTKGAEMLRLEIQSSRPVYIKNFRLAQGGDDAYKKVISDGKFVAYGIQFDVNKALLKPESMGTINEFVKMMKEKPELNFEIGGHTDNDGTIERNQILSKERAEAVKTQMIAQGIDASRLTTKGYGASEPVAENNNAENKAKNRRVVFIKK